MTNKTKPIAALAVAAALLAGGAAQASIDNTVHGPWAKVGAAAAGHGPQGSGAPLVVDLAGLASFDSLNAAPNTRWSVAAAPGVLIDAVEYELTLGTVGESWLSEASVRITNSAGDGVTLRPGFQLNSGGSHSFSGAASLTALDMAFRVGADGRLFVQLYEDYDDLAGGIDAVFSAGSITLSGAAVSAVPDAPARALLVLGLLALAPALRRRRRG